MIYADATLMRARLIFAAPRELHAAPLVRYVTRRYRHYAVLLRHEV